MAEDDLEPQPDMLLYLEKPDELLTYYRSLARAMDMVYVTAAQQLTTRIYRDHDWLKAQEIQGKPCAYADDRREDIAAMAYVLMLCRRYVPEEVRRASPPPRAIRKYKQRRKQQP